MSHRFLDQGINHSSNLESLILWLRGSAITQEGFSEVDEQASVYKRSETEKSYYNEGKWVQINMRGRVKISMQEIYREQREATVE